MEDQCLDSESSAVQTHLNIMQDVIRRMADNSRSCKVWCVTLVSATLVLVARMENAQHALIALVPAVLFLLLDTYYLALERGYRDSYEALVQKLHNNELRLPDLYVVKPSGTIPLLCWHSLPSFSIWPFYLMLAVLVLFSRFFITS